MNSRQKKVAMKLSTYDLEDVSSSFNCWREMARVDKHDRFGEWVKTEDVAKIIDELLRCCERMGLIVNVDELVDIDPSEDDAPVR